MRSLKLLSGEMPIVWLSCLFSGDARNLTKAEAWASHLTLVFDTPFIVPWVPLCRFWSNEGSELEKAREANEKTMKASGAVAFAGVCMSEGMHREREIAQTLGLPAYNFVGRSPEWFLKHKEKIEGLLRAGRVAYHDMSVLNDEGE